MTFTREHNREIWAEEGLPVEKADSWFAKQEKSDWILPDGKKIKSREAISRRSALRLLEKMSAAERVMFKPSSKPEEEVNRPFVSSDMPLNDRVKEMFRNRMIGVGWVADDGNPVVDKESYISYLAHKYLFDRG